MENKQASKKVYWFSYVALIAAILFFSGVFTNSQAWYKVLDFSVLNGDFGKIIVQGSKTATYTFRGVGGSGAKDGFAFALTLMPASIFALGVVGVIEGLGGLDAAHKLMTPLLRPLLGVPGVCGLALIASMQSTDAGAGMTKELYQNNLITDDERTLFSMFQITGDGIITNYFATGAALFGIITTPIIMPFLIIMGLKVVSTNILRIIVKLLNKKEANLA